MNPAETSFRLRYDLPSRVLLTVLGLGSRFGRVVVTDNTVRVRMGWGFWATVSRSAIRGTQQRHRRFVISRGVHGWRGNWLVNGSGSGLVELTLGPTGQARVCGFPVRLRRLTVAVEDPAGLVAALSTSAAREISGL